MLKLYALYSLFFALVLCFWSCELKPEKVRHKVKRQLVFAVNDAVDSSALVKKRYLEAHKDTSYIEYVFMAYDLVNIKDMDTSIRVDLRYADTANFLKRNLYDGLRKAYFTCETAGKLCAAQYYLKLLDPDLSLVVLDATRPQHIQQLMWDSLKISVFKKFTYLSPPDETSLHNYGCAVDATIFNERTNQFLEMGTSYDFFDKLAQPIYEAHFLKTGELSREAFNNRKLLRTVMKRAHLNPITSEWWHFSSMSREEAVKRFPLVK
ncbi:MAG: M15 family metallopeptidase [bacterium]|nr:M15 family metallopeptidase [bacterium]